MPTVQEAILEAIGHHRAGRLEQAEAIYRRVLSQFPEHPDALHLLGVVCTERGDAQTGLDLISRALAINPHSATYHLNLSRSLRDLGRHDQALAAARRAVELRPDDADGWLNLRNIALAAGDIDQAIEALRRAIGLAATAQLYIDLGNLLRSRYRLPEAQQAYRQAVALDPRSASAANNLGVALMEQGRASEAVQQFAHTLSINPRHENALLNLGILYRRDGQLAPAVDCLRRLLAIAPRNAEAIVELAAALAQQGHTTESEARLHEAIRLRPSPRLRVVEATLLPPIFTSREHLLEWRHRLESRVQRLHADGVKLDIAADVARHMFYLPYQGMDDRAIMQRLAELYVPPKMDRPAGSGDGWRIHVGFVSRYFRNHTIGRLMAGMIQRLDRRDFHVTVFFFDRRKDELAQRIASSADATVDLPDSVAMSRQVISAAKLDVLFYTDVGMEPLNYTLAMSRLAPVQCVTWGHPDTTGSPEMDYFISGTDLDTDAGRQFYTERLVRLAHLPIVYDRPVTPGRPRGHFGLPDDAHLYGCPQSLFKFHPDFDAVLAGILRRDPRGMLVLLEAHEPNWTRILRTRLAAAMPDAIERIRFLPAQPYQNFLALCGLFDVMLDPLHFGGGNTTYEALAAGTPVVTLPGQYLRGRIAFALYRSMGVMDCVVRSAEQYADLAVRLGTDRDLRAQVSRRIDACSNVLFGNESGVRELEAFLKEAVATAKRR